MSHSDIENAIDNAWDDAASITPNTKGEVRDAVEAAIDGVSEGPPALDPAFADDASEAVVISSSEGEWADVVGSELEVISCKSYKCSLAICF